MAEQQKVARGLGIDTGLADALKKTLSSDRWSKIVERAITQAESGDQNARDFLHEASVACW